MLPSNLFFARTIGVRRLASPSPRRKATAMAAAKPLAPEMVQAVRAASRIEQVTAEYTRLRRSGQDLIGLCPFHSERTPSLSVSPSKQLFFCHGCHAGGDVFAFVGRILGCNFLRAVEHLARLAGIEFRHAKVGRAEMDRSWRLRERSESAAWRVRDEIVRLRRLYRGRLLRSEKLTLAIGGRLRNECDLEKREALWGTLQRLAVVETFSLAAFQFVFRAGAETLTRFVVLSPAERRAMVLSWEPKP